MRDATTHRTGTPLIDRGEGEVQGRCQSCGRQGRVLQVVDAPPPNQFCERCAIEYGELLMPPEDDASPTP